MRKIIMAMAICFIAGTAHAEPLKLSEELQKFPPLKQGIGFSLQDYKLNYLSTIELARWKGFSLEAGYAGRAENTGDKAVAVISYQIAKAKDLGVTLPILDLLEANVGVYAGFGRIQVNDGFDNGNNEFDWGVSATLISLKF